MNNPNLRKRLEGHLDNLPVLPLAIAKLMALDPNDDEYFDQVLDVLEAEPNFAARILMAANSAESSPTSPVSTLQGAIARIGSRGATNLVLALAVTRVFVPRDPWEQSLWRHGVQVAQAARGLARHGADPDLDPDVAYTVGLLHDVGRFVMFQEAPEQLRLVDEGGWESPQELVEQELAICGLSHTEIGAMACTKWRLPDVVNEAVRCHHDPLPEQLTDPVDKMTAIVRLADLAMFPSAVPGSRSLDETLDDEGLLEHLGPKVPSFLNLSGGRLLAVVSAARTDADEACRALGIGG